MKIFMLFLLAAVMVTAVPHALTSDEGKLQRVILEEIIQCIKGMKNSLAAEIFVQNVITTDHCTHTKFCKAGNILSKYNAKELGLQETDWLLPRKLVAYTRDITCEEPVAEDRVKLHQLLDNIHLCAQKLYTKL